VNRQAQYLEAEATPDPGFPDSGKVGQPVPITTTGEGTGKL